MNAWMEQQLQSMMARLRDDGYTLAEMLVVLTIMSVLSLVMISGVSKTYQHYALEKQVEFVMSLAMRAKYDAYLTKETKNISIYEDYVVYGDEVHENYGKIVAEEAVELTYNANGNIQVANTVTYTNDFEEISIVFWIGGGYFEIKE